MKPKIVFCLALPAAIAFIQITDVAQAATPRPIMADATHGWSQEFTDKQSLILHTTNGGKHWFDISPPALSAAAKKLASDYGNISDCVSLCPLDGQRAWVAIAAVREPIYSNAVLLEYTSDAGLHWRETVTPIATDGVSISFLDSLHGFLLATDSPAGGKMNMKVYRTENGGKYWEALASPTVRGFYATGIVFRSRSDGWVTGTYHGGDDAPLYHTQDGGKSWQLQHFEIPADYRGGYADTYPPVFIGVDKKHGYLPVKLVRHDSQPGRSAWVNCESDDGGRAWHLPASGIQSIPGN